MTNDEKIIAAAKKVVDSADIRSGAILDELNQAHAHLIVAAKLADREGFTGLRHLIVTANLATEDAREVAG